MIMVKAATLAMEAPLSLDDARRIEAMFVEYCCQKPFDCPVGYWSGYAQQAQAVVVGVRGILLERD